MNIISLSPVNKNGAFVFLNKHKYIIAFGIFIAYLCLSLYKIGNNSLWYDEVYSIDLANDSITGIIDNAILEDVNPPLYLIILHYWLNLFGESEMALRSLSAVSMSLGCGTLFLFCLRFFNWQTAIFSTLLFFTSNELYYYSEEGRTFGLIILFCVLSNYAFMSFVKSPNWKNVLLLGVFNSIIFYLHTLASLIFVAQIILVPILTFNKQVFLKKGDSSFSFLGYKLKQALYYIISWIIFGLLFLPWQERFFELLSQASGGYWLTKPTSWDVNKSLFEFYNSKELFFVYLSSFILILLTIIFIKKLREESFDYRLILIPIIMGPVLILINYEISVYSTPIFLKRYILFTIIGLIITYAYVLSLLKVDFKIKLSLFSVLIIFSACKMSVPRPLWSDFKSGVEILKKVEGPRCYISTDMPALFAYYIDRDGIFKAPRAERDKLLANRGIYSQTTVYWANSLDFSKFDDIYYTRTFDDYYDPNRLIDKTLNSKLVMMEDLPITGIHITHYSVPIANRDSVIEIYRQDIINNKGWYSQITQKAKDRNISVDSMVTLDAIWNYEQTCKSRK